MADQERKVNTPLDALTYSIMCSDVDAGPACMRIQVPPTIVMDDGFREPYCQGWRHALAAVREWLRFRGLAMHHYSKELEPCEKDWQVERSKVGSRVRFTTRTGDGAPFDVYMSEDEALALSYQLLTAVLSR